MSYVFEPPAIVAADFSSQNTDKVHCSSALARHMGLVTGVIMSDVWYWTSRNLGRWEGWFYRSQEDWQEKTGLSEDSITRYLKKLEDSGYVESRRGKHPEAVSNKQWVKFYRATQTFNRLYAEVLASEGIEDKTAKCGSEKGRKPQNADLNGDKTAKCGSEKGRKPQNADLWGLESLQGEVFSPPQGSKDQGNISQGSKDPLPPLENEPLKAPARKGPDYPRWVEAYLGHKPPAWKGMDAIEGNTARENCVKRAIKAFGGDESKAIERMVLALDYITQKGDAFWREQKHSFDAILREKSMYMVEWAESALEEGFKATSPNEDPAFLNKQIAQAQSRLGIVGQPPKEWREKTGCKTVGDMSVAQKREYLDWLISRSENDGNGTTSPMSGSYSAETLARVA